MAILFLWFLPLLPAQAGGTQTKPVSPAEDPGNTFAARPVEKPGVDSDPNYIIADGKVIKNPKKSAASTDSNSNESEPNFISVDGKVIPNPKKHNPNTAPAGEEPNFISLNGRVVPNPNKKSAA